MVMAALTNRIDRERLMRVSDGLAVAVAVSLPWSTSATAILVVAWLLALVPTLDGPRLRREIMSPAGGLPVLLFLLGVAGVLWADVSLLERWKGLDSFFKLLVIPLLLVQFRRSDRGTWVFVGYLYSCLALLVATAIVMAIPPLSAALMHSDLVLVKNPATQSGEFVTCIFGLAYLAIDAFERRRWWWFAGTLAAILGMLANIFFVATGRTALVVIPVLLALLALKRLNLRGRVIVFAAAVAVAAIGWFSSPYLRERTETIWTDLQKYEATEERNSSGERVEFAVRSIEFIREAPVIGHGTGSIRALFARAAGPGEAATTNPHNQTFAVAIQLGLVGVAVLWTMWIAHLLLFRGAGLVAWIGLVVVAQNIVGSLFNSHLFDFTQGWVYVFGVGVAGGMMLKQRAPP